MSLKSFVFLTVLLPWWGACAATMEDAEAGTESEGQSNTTSSWIYPLLPQYIPQGATPSSTAFKQIEYGVPNPNLSGWSSCYRASMSTLTHAGVDWVAYQNNRTQSWAVGKKVYQEPPSVTSTSTAPASVVGVYAVHDGTIVAVDPLVAGYAADEGASIAIRHELSASEKAVFEAMNIFGIQAVYSVYAHVLPTPAIAALKTDQTLAVKKGDVLGILYDNPGYTVADGTVRANDLLYFEMRWDYGQSLWAEPCRGNLAPAFVKTASDLTRYGYVDPRGMLDMLAHVAP